MVTRDELSSIGDDDLQGFKNSINIPPEKLDTNFNTIKARYNTLQTFVKDETVSKDEQNEYGARQDFNAGIRTSRIDADTDGEDILLAEEGSGRIKIEKEDESVETVATEEHVAAQITAAATVTGIVATPATDSSNGTAGAVPAADIDERFLPYRGKGFSSGWEVETTNFTVVNGGKYIVGSSVTAITLPNSPTAGYEFQLAAGNGTDLSNVTLTQAASGEYINGANAGLALDTSTILVKGALVNTGASGAGWRVEESSPVAAETDNATNGGRLTLEPGVPLSISDQTAKTTVYWTPAYGYVCKVWDGSAWIARTFPETSFAVPSNADTNNDIFVYDNNGTLAIETVAWSNDTTRATAITYTDGVLTKSGDKTRRYIGTVRTTSVSGQTQTTSASWLLYNEYNKRDITLTADKGTTEWTYSGTTLRAAAGVTTVGETRVEAVFGNPVYVRGTVGATAEPTSTIDAAVVGIAKSATNANDAIFKVNTLVSGGGSRPAHAQYGSSTDAGYYYYQWVENTKNGVGVRFNYQGSGGETGQNAGLVMEVTI